MAKKTAPLHHESDALVVYRVRKDMRVFFGAAHKNRVAYTEGEYVNRIPPGQSHKVERVTLTEQQLRTTTINNIDRWCGDRQPEEELTDLRKTLDRQRDAIRNETEANERRLAVIELKESTLDRRAGALIDKEKELDQREEVLDAREDDLNSRSEAIEKLVHELDIDEETLAEAYRKAGIEPDEPADDDDDDDGDDGDDDGDKEN